jgi:parvulin-like peptidyl-prolyl isomerase
MTRVPFFLLAAFALVFSCEPLFSQQQGIVARIANKYTISFPELRQYVIDYQYVYRYRRNVVEATDKALEDMIVDRMKIIDFFDRGLNEKKEDLQGITRILNEELAIEYYNTQFYQKYVNEDAIQNAYREMRREVIYRQIVLWKPEKGHAQAIDSLRSLLKKIIMRIDSGADFSDLARQYSQDVESANNGGLMPPLSWKMTLSRSLYDTLFHLAVNHSNITEDEKAIRIVRVDKIDTVDVPPYSQVKEDIRKALSEKYMAAASNEFDRAKKNLLDERTLQWNEKGIKQLLRWSDIPRFYEAAYSDTIGYAISHGNNFLILKYYKGKVDLKEYLRLVNEVLTLGNISSIKEDDFKKYVLEAVRTDMLVKKARRLGLEKEIFNPQTKNPDLESGIIRIYNNEVIEKQIPPATAEALKAFYQANKDSLYYQFARVNIYAVIDSSRSAIEEARGKLEHGVAFNKLASTIWVKTFIRKHDSTIVSYFSIEPPYLGEAAFKLKLNEVAGPIEYHDSANGNQYALIKCMEKREEKQSTYDDVKNTIVSDFANYYRNKIAQSVAEELRKKYPVAVYKDVLQQSLSSSGITTPQ